MNPNINIKIPSNPKNIQPDDYEQQMLDHAVAFFQAGSRCEAGFQISPNITSSLIAPSAVCYALSIEIYFKLLLKISNLEFPKKHDFIILFETLPKNIKEEIIKRARISESEFIKMMIPISETFVKWRYLYELDSSWTSISNLTILVKILHNVVRNNKPTLKVTFENNLALPEDFPY